MAVVVGHGGEDKLLGESELESYGMLVIKLVSLQKQLDTTYHHDRFLRHRLVTAADIPSIHTFSSNRTLRMTY